MIILSAAGLSRTYLDKAYTSNADLTFSIPAHSILCEWSRVLPRPSVRFNLKLSEATPIAESWQTDNFTNGKVWRQTHTANLNVASLPYTNSSDSSMEDVKL